MFRPFVVRLLPNRFTLRRESSKKREGVGDESHLAAFSLTDVVAVDLDGSRPRRRELESLDVAVIASRVSS
jgi:hypothetical protein